VQDFGNFGSSDHKLIFCNLHTDVGIVTEFKTRFHYNCTDIQGLRDESRLVNWMSVLLGSVEECCSKFKSILLGLWNKFVPVIVDKDKGEVPWMNYKALKCIKKKHKVSRNIKKVVTQLVKGCLK